MQKKKIEKKVATTRGRDTSSALSCSGLGLGLATVTTSMRRTNTDVSVTGSTITKTKAKAANKGVRPPRLICSSVVFFLTPPPAPPRRQTGSTLLRWAGVPFPRLQTDPQRSVCPPSCVLMLPVPASSCLFRMREGWRRGNGAVTRQENVGKKGIFDKNAPLINSRYAGSHKTELDYTS